MYIAAAFLTVTKRALRSVKRQQVQINFAYPAPRFTWHHLGTDFCFLVQSKQRLCLRNTNNLKLTLQIKTEQKFALTV